jgi:uroporphyrin-III C-methyltransferase/precorrin-2 dehydrogenase/sirohydrochlorin ferrochelatase
MNQPSLFPMFAKIASKHCLVVGAGTVALQKIQALLQCGAIVHVTAPQANASVRQLADSGEISLALRTYEDGDLRDKFLVILATNDSDLHRRICHRCNERNILVNTVDEPALCDFYFGSTIQRGALQIAISTSGQSPSSAKVIRQSIEKLLAEEAGDVLDKLGVLRRSILSLNFPKDLQHEMLHQLAGNILAREPKQKARVKKEAEPGMVYLVGAGPGDPSLLTERALLLLGSADVVLYDGLIPDETLHRAGKQAILIPVPKRCGDKAITQEQIHALMIALARQNFSIVRLKSGDPLVFGRAGEEMDALRQADIPFVLVPGITSAAAAATAARVSLSDRRYASQIVFATGHRANDGSTVPTYDKQATIAFYMAGKRLQEIARSCIESGYPSDMPCTIVENAAREQQRVVYSPLAQLEQLAPLNGPSILLIGWGMAQHSPE